MKIAPLNPTVVATPSCSLSPVCACTRAFCVRSRVSRTMDRMMYIVPRSHFFFAQSSAKHANVCCLQHSRLVFCSLSLSPCVCVLFAQIFPLPHVASWLSQEIFSTLTWKLSSFPFSSLLRTKTIDINSVSTRACVCACVRACVCVCAAHTGKKTVELQVTDRPHKKRERESDFLRRGMVALITYAYV